MKEGGTGGGNTKSGLHFEKDVDFLTLLSEIEGYEVKDVKGKAGKGIYFKDELVARCFKKYAFYSFLEEHGINWRDYFSKRLLPDDALLVQVRNTLFILEVKFQKVAGSVDEKLQTCDFKRKQYIKILRPLNLQVEYIYILNDWFKKPEYKDVLEYIPSVNCNYRFNTLPLEWLGLPT